mmetsp:Transcript_35865/g.54407  ORF Transcript_35865/g.54407 Transcript_35865/m.54407 type:complete len:816 (+) Transcript_35865:114-2561(+)
MDMHQAWNSKTDDGPRPGGSVPLFLLADAADDCHQEQLKIGSKAATNAERRSPPGPSDDGSLNKRAALEQEKWLQHLTQQGVGAAYQNSKKQCAEAQVANNSREFVAASAQDDATRWAIAAALSQQQPQHIYQQQQHIYQHQHAPQAQSYAIQLQQLQEAVHFQQAEPHLRHHQLQQLHAAAAYANTSDLQAAAAAQQLQQATQLQQDQLQQLAQLQQMQQAAQLQDLMWGAGIPQSQLDSLLLAQAISARNQGHAATSAQQQQQLAHGATLAASGNPSMSFARLLYLQNQQAQELEIQQVLQQHQARSAEAAYVTAQQNAIAQAAMAQKQAAATAMKQQQQAQPKQQQHTQARFQQQHQQKQQQQAKAPPKPSSQQRQEHLDCIEKTSHGRGESRPQATSNASTPDMSRGDAPSSVNKDAFHAPSITKAAACPVASPPAITAIANNSTKEVEKTADQFKKVRGGMVIDCRASGMPMDHNFKTAYFRISENIEHGEELICSHCSCRNAGIKFRYCIKCMVPVAKQNFHRHHRHSCTNIANLSGETDGEDNDSDEGSFVASVISSKNNKQSSNSHTISPPSSLLCGGVAPNMPSVVVDAGPSTEMMTESLGFGPNALPEHSTSPSKIAKQEESSKKAAKALDLKNVISKGAAAVYPSSVASQLVASSQCSEVSAHPSTATSSSGQLDKGKGGSESVPKSCGGDGHGSVLDGRKRRWSSLLVGRPALGDSNAMSAWLLEVLVVSDLDKPLKDDDNVARAELASASINDGSSQKRPKLESEIRDDLQTTKKAEAHNWGNGGSVPTFASLKYKKRGRQN